MSAELSIVGEDWAERTEKFVAEEVKPVAEVCDREERIPPRLLSSLRSSGLLGAHLPLEYGGSACDPLVIGDIHRIVGAASASVEGVINVHQMATRTIERRNAISHERKSTR